MRDLPTDIAERLIVALDVDSVDDARAMVRQLDGTVSFFKIGFWLILKPGIHGLIDELVGSGKKVFLDMKMYDIGETVRRGVAAAAALGVSFLTVHGDTDIMQAAVQGRGGTGLKIFAVSVLTSLGEDGLRDMGYGKGMGELVALRVAKAAAAGCDGVIASATDNPDVLRRDAGSESLLVATPGIRLASDTTDDHARPGNPADAIHSGADYLVVGRPVVRDQLPRAKAQAIIAEMRRGAERRPS